MSLSALSTQLAKTVDKYLEGLLDHLAREFEGRVTEEEIKKAARAFTGEVAKKKPAKADKPPLPETLTLILNYGPASHALIGESTKALNEAGFFARMNEGKPFLKFHPGLAFGPGWIIMDKTKLKLLEDALEADGYGYETIERAEYEKKVSAGK